MNRREFTKSLAAAAAAPALPLRRAAAAPAITIPPALYAKAAHWAGMWTFSTAATFRNILGVDQAFADTVFQQLQDDGVLDRADAGGIAMAIRPWFREPAIAARLAAVTKGGTATAEGSGLDTLRDAARVVDDVIGDDDLDKIGEETPATPTPDTPA